MVIGKRLALGAPLATLALLLFVNVASAQLIPVQIINNAPGTETILIDVYVDGTRVADDLAFTTATPFVDGIGNPQILVLPTSIVDVVAPGDPDNSSPLYTEDLTGQLAAAGLLEVIGLVTPIANPDGRDTSLDLVVFSGYEPAAGAVDEVRLMAVHGTPDLGTVDLLARQQFDSPRTTLISGLAYGDALPYVTIAAEPVVLEMVETGTTNVIKSWTADFRLVTGAGVVGNAGGFAADPTLFGAVASGFVFVLNAVPTAVEEGVPSKGKALGQNFPNPFNPRTTIPISIQSGQSIKLSIYDAQGRLVQTLFDGVMPEGAHEIPFTGEGLSSGTYFYELRTDQGTERHSMSLIK